MFKFLFLYLIKEGFICLLIFFYLLLFFDILRSTLNKRHIYKNQTIYLAEERHTNWREQLSSEAKKDDLPLTFVSPQTNHDRSDSIGEDILGNQPSQLYTDDAASDINNFRMKVMMEKADIVVALFGEDYKQ